MVMVGVFWPILFITEVIRLVSKGSKNRQNS